MQTALALFERFQSFTKLYQPLHATRMQHRVRALFIIEHSTSAASRPGPSLRSRSADKHQGGLSKKNAHRNEKMAGRLSRSGWACAHGGCRRNSSGTGGLPPGFTLPWGCHTNQGASPMSASQSEISLDPDGDDFILRVIGDGQTNEVRLTSDHVLALGQSALSFHQLIMSRRHPGAVPRATLKRLTAT